MSNPWLTIITITKDDVAGLTRTLASAAALRAAGVEQVVIDGGSGADGAGEMAARAAGITTVERRPPQGIADAFNAGLALARGEWVWFLNGGDQVDARLTPAALAAWLGSTRADVLIGGTTYEGEAEPRPHPPRELQWPPFRSWIPHPSTLVRRRLFAQFGGFDGRYTIAMDYEWWLRVFSHPVAVDVLAAPFAVFAPGGLSQRPEMLPVIRREKRHALWRHQSALWRPWWSANYLLARAWVLALLSHRLGQPPRSS